MAEKIYRLVLANPRDEWYQLSKEEQDSLWAKVTKLFEEAGGKRIIVCGSRWSSETMYGFMVEEFPDIKAEQKYVQALEEMNWFRYHNATTYLGTKWEA